LDTRWRILASRAPCSSRKRPRRSPSAVAGNGKRSSRLFSGVVRVLPTVEIPRSTRLTGAA
jgi:hypothetical protein